MIDVQKYGARDFAVYEDGALLAVVRYRKGAEAIKKRIDSLQQQLQKTEALTPRLEQP